MKNGLKPLQRAKANALLNALDQHDWNFQATADYLQMTNSNLRSMAKGYGLLKLKHVPVKRWVKA